MTKIDSYNGTGQTLGNYIDGILKANNELAGVSGAPHLNFWDTLSYSDFINGTVPNVNFGPNPPYPIVELGNGLGSNFVLALQGQGPLFNNNDGAFGQMPQNANPPSMPYFTQEQVQPIIDWIDLKCPNPGGK